MPCYGNVPPDLAHARRCKLRILLLFSIRETVPQFDLERRFIPKVIHLLVRPIRALGRQGEIKVVQQFAEDQPDLAIGQSTHTE